MTWDTMSKYLVLFLLAGQAVTAQTCNGSITIGDSAAASSLASACPTFVGDISIANNATGEMVFNGLQQVNGSVYANNVSGLSSLASDSLFFILGDLDLESLDSLSSISFPNLTIVDRVLLEDIPKQQDLSLANADGPLYLYVNNTGISKIEGLKADFIYGITITNNANLNSITLQPNTVSTLEIGFNGPDLSVEMPDLVAVDSVVFRNCSSISVTFLARVNQTLILDTNTQMSTFDFPSLTSIGADSVVGDLQILNNPDLGRLQFPLLEIIGGDLQVTNNSALVNFTGFDRLRTVSHTVDLEGDFQSVDFLSSLSYVGGNLLVNSTADLSCDAPRELFHNGVIGQYYGCTSANDSSNSYQEYPVTKSAGLSTGAKAGIGIAAALGGLLILALVAICLRRRRRSHSHLKGLRHGGVVDLDIPLGSVDPPEYEAGPPAYDRFQHGELMRNA